jgi:anaerobic selenocysteine-containing dehydrogenase
MCYICIGGSVVFSVSVFGMGVWWINVGEMWQDSNCSVCAGGGADEEKRVKEEQRRQLEADRIFVSFERQLTIKFHTRNLYCSQFAK